MTPQNPVAMERSCTVSTLQPKPAHTQGRPPTRPHPYVRYSRRASSPCPVASPCCSPSVEQASLIRLSPTSFQRIGGYPEAASDPPRRRAVRRPRRLDRRGGHRSVRLFLQGAGRGKRCGPSWRLPAGLVTGCKTVGQRGPPTAQTFAQASTLAQVFLAVLPRRTMRPRSSRTIVLKVGRSSGRCERQARPSRP
jgi:hypothetical protein